MMPIRYDDAIPLHEEWLALRRRVSGEPSVEVAISVGNHALALLGAERGADAEAAGR